MHCTTLFAGSHYPHCLGSFPKDSFGRISQCVNFCHFHLFCFHSSLLLWEASGVRAMLPCVRCSLLLPCSLRRFLPLAAVAAAVAMLGCDFCPSVAVVFADVLRYMVLFSAVFR